ncbi:T9SS type A sorting domain-containing protein [Flavobacterium aquiphilum]|uniref:T9SS type A sorting domain-containing protein n=1 Tax=Flavobacterium aquiphilum TaxID=3003261 RepID=UPI0024819454|nr:T9SS type A sorting domain-containing protein [Flavobacterium aquiphilum]
MRLLLPKSPFLTFIFLIANLFFANASFGQTVSLDQADLDYAPGETVYITGTGWYPNEIINLQVDHLTQPIPDHGTPDPHQPWTVVADSSGNFTASWFVTDYELGANLLLNADGLLSGYTYEVFFTDASNFDSASITPQSTSLTYGTGGTVTYTIEIDRSGNGNLDVTLSIDPLNLLPIGAILVSFNPATVSFSGNTPTSKTSNLSISTLNTLNAGTYSFKVKAVGGGVTKLIDATLVINKATPTATLIVNNSPVSYTGSGQSAIVGISTSSVPGTVSNVLTGGSATQTAAGTYPVMASFVPTDSANYNTLTGLSAGNFVINKAESAITATGTTSFIYNGSAQGPISSIVTGSTGVVTYSYSGVSPTVYSASATPPTNAGAYQVVATVASDVNYNGASSVPLAFTIGKAFSTTTVSIVGGPFTYTGSAQTPATVSVTGVGGLSLTPTADYANNTNAGTATASYTYAGDDNYLGSSDSKTFDIAKASSTTTVTIVGGPFTYTGSAQTPATVSVSGVGGLSLSPTADYANNTNAGTATASYTYAGDANHEGSSDSKTFDIDKASSTTTVSIVGGPFAYTGSAQTPATVSVSGVGGLSLSPTADYANNTNAGTATASYTYAGDANHEGSSDSKTFDIGKASSTTTVTIVGGPFTYTGSAQTPATVSVSGVGGLSLSPTADYANNTNAGTATASYTYAGDANHEGSSDSKTFDIGKASSTTTVTIVGEPFMYTGSAQTPATVSVSGVGGLSLSPTADYANNTNAGTATASYTYAGDANHEGSSDSKTFDIGKASSTTTVTIVGGSFTYSGSAQTPATVSVTGVGGLSLTPTADYANNTNAGTATASYTYAGDANHETSSDSKTFVINKADAVVTVNGYTGVYDAAAHGATGSAVGVAGDLSATGSTLNLGSSFTNVPGGTANWTFTGGTNYNDQSGSVAIVISQATASIVVNGYAGTYDVTAHGASLVSATGVASADLSSSVIIAPTTYTNYPGGTVGWSFANNNYAPQSGSVDITINKADAVVTVNGYTGVYDAAAHGATGSAVGVAGDLSATGSTLNLGSSFTNVPGGTANWTFTGGTNYNDQSGSVTIAISKATASIVVNGYAGTYDATAHGASLVSATGVADADLSSSVTIVPTTYTNYPGGTVGWSFANNNYAPQSGTVDITINKANAVVTVNGYTGVYDAAAHGATGTAVGVAGDLSATGSTLNLGSSFTNVPGGTANWIFTGGTNYNDQSGSAAIVISQATANIVVNGYVGTYDATAHGASLVSATGVADADLSSSVTIAPTTYTNYPGGTVGWSFANNNYAPQSGTVDITINKANAVVTVTGYTGVYDAAAHGATGSAVGVAGDLSATGSTLNLGSSFTNVPGGTANWTFTGGTNYNDQSGSVTIAISKANTTVSVTGGGTFNFDNIAHAVTAYAVGVEGDHIVTPFTFSYVGTNCAGAYNSATAPSAPGTYTATATFVGNSNYNGSSSTAIIIINSTLSATIATNKSNLYFGFSGGDTATITVKPTGGQAPYRVSITMVNPQTVLPGRIKERVDGKLICDYINAAGDEVWIPGANTNSTTGNSCDNQPTSTSNANISMGGSYSVNATLLTDARFVATVTDANGCSYTIPVESAARVDAEDARCFAGKSGVEKVTLCHKTGSAKNPCMEICVDQSAVQEHLNHGDFLGKCTNNCLPPVANAKHLGTGKTLIEDTADEIVEFNVIAYPNPSNYQFSLAVTSGSNEKVEVLVYNMSARLIKRIEKSNEKTILFGEDLPAGEYLVLVRQGENQKAVNVIKK